MQWWRRSQNASVVRTLQHLTWQELRAGWVACLIHYSRKAMSVCLPTVSEEGDEGNEADIWETCSVRIREHNCAEAHVFLDVYIHAHVRIHTDIHTHTLILTFTPTLTHTRTHAHTRTHTHIHTYPHIHLDTRSRPKHTSTLTH